MAYRQRNQSLFFSRHTADTDLSPGFLSPANTCEIKRVAKKERERDKQASILANRTIPLDGYVIQSYATQVA